MQLGDCTKLLLLSSLMAALMRQSKKGGRAGRHTDSLTDRPLAAAKDIVENLLSLPLPLCHPPSNHVSEQSSTPAHRTPLPLPNCCPHVSSLSSLYHITLTYSLTHTQLTLTLTFLISSLTLSLSRSLSLGAAHLYSRAQTVNNQHRFNFLRFFFLLLTRIPLPLSFFFFLSSSP